MTGEGPGHANGSAVGTRAECVRFIEALGAVAVVRLHEASRLRAVAEALAEGGVRAVEITMTMRGAIDGLSALSGAYGDRLAIGAGSVLDEETARLAILAGARFVVAPIFRAGMVAACHRYDVAAVPGAYTPTEILSAWEAGADLVKVFPAGGLGPEYLRDLRAPMPHIRLFPTGGVTADNAAAFLQAGAVAVGVGGALIERDALSRGDYGRITQQARRLSAAVRAARERPR
jgi:2-dehydro-3-deoxyphosphogluconate aldolase/(4S)-4-hydroxy-2-oxoglutarate aldolase